MVQQATPEEISNDFKTIGAIPQLAKEFVLQARQISNQEPLVNSDVKNTKKDCSCRGGFHTIRQNSTTAASLLD